MSLETVDEWAVDVLVFGFGGGAAEVVSLGAEALGFLALRLEDSNWGAERLGGLVGAGGEEGSISLGWKVGGRWWWWRVRLGGWKVSGHRGWRRGFDFGGGGLAE